MITDDELCKECTVTIWDMPTGMRVSIDHNTGIHVEAGSVELGLEVLRDMLMSRYRDTGEKEH